MSRKNTSRKGVTRKTKKPEKTNGTTTKQILELAEFRVIARILIALCFAAAVIWLATLPVENSNPISEATSNNQQPNDSATMRYDGFSYEDFTFYSKLKDFKVAVAEENPYAKNDSNYVTHYLIQAGAFADNDSAEEQLIMLSLLDLDARIEKDRNWHRILIGPLKSRSSMSAAREKLIDNGIEAQVMTSRKRAAKKDS